MAPLGLTPVSRGELPLMPVYQLSYLCGSGASEVIVAESPDEAEDMARRRLLFREPGFTIAILFEGVELGRVTQRALARAPRLSAYDPTAFPRGFTHRSAALAERSSEISP